MSHEAKEETHDGVDCPGVQPPVVEGEDYGLLRQLVVGQCVVCCEPLSNTNSFSLLLILLDYYLPVGANVVKDGLSHAIEEDPSAHTTGKQHAEPGGIIVLRL